MPKFAVTKVLDFCYGHRLLNYEGKCKHLHGHQARVEIELASSTLDKRGMVCDFLEIKKILQPWINENLDHKMILNETDPLISVLQKQGEPLFLMPQNPTAENLAKLLFDQARQMGLPVEAVRLWENADSFATYRRSLG